MNPAAVLLSCVVILNAGSGEVTRTGDRCGTALSPASTFKIPHAPVALATGVVTADTVEKWDGTRHPEQPSWDRDHTVLSAMRPGVQGADDPAIACLTAVMSARSAGNPRVLRSATLVPPTHTDSSPRPPTSSVASSPVSFLMSAATREARGR